MGGERAEDFELNKSYIDILRLEKNPSSVRLKSIKSLSCSFLREMENDKIAPICPLNWVISGAASVSEGFCTM